MDSQQIARLLGEYGKHLAPVVREYVEAEVNRRDADTQRKLQDLQDEVDRLTLQVEAAKAWSE